jgi:hypothetical protein
MKTLFLFLFCSLFASINAAHAGDVLFDVYIKGETQPCPGTTTRYSISGDAANGFNIQINKDAGTIVEWTDFGGTKYSNVTSQEISTPGYSANSALSVTIKWTNVRGTVGHLHVTTSNNGFFWNNNHGDRTYEIAVGSPDITSTTSTEVNCDIAHPIFSIPIVSGANSYSWRNTMGWVIENTYVNGGYASVTFSAINSTATSGQVTVTAMNSGCPSTNSTKTFTVSRATGTHYVVGPDNIPGGTRTVYNAPDGCSNYNWSFPNGWIISQGQGTASVIVQVNNADCPGDLYVTYIDLCGQPQIGTKYINSTYQSGPVPPSTQDVKGISASEDSGVAKSVTPEPGFYPNPATSQLTVNLGEGGKAVIYNNLGAVVREIVFPVGSVSSSINTLSLPTGIYHIRLFRDGKQLLDKPLSVHH